jgi:hypothetical protein
MLDVTPIPFPVPNPALRFGNWWRAAQTFILLAGQYGKFLFANARRILPRFGRFATGAND